MFSPPSHFLDPVFYLRSLKSISTIMFVQCVNDCHLSHVFSHEGLDDLPRLHFHEKRHIIGIFRVVLTGLCGEPACWPRAILPQPSFYQSMQFVPEPSARANLIFAGDPVKSNMVRLSLTETAKPNDADTGRASLGCLRRWLENPVQSQAMTLDWVKPISLHRFMIALCSR
jgi:hypothetical protein